MQIPYLSLRAAITSNYKQHKTDICLSQSGGQWSEIKVLAESVPLCQHLGVVSGLGRSLAADASQLRLLFHRPPLWICVSNLSVLSFIRTLVMGCKAHPKSRLASSPRSSP